MLDPVDGEDSASTSSCPLVRKGSTISTQSTDTQNSNDSMKASCSQSDTTKTAENTQNEIENKSSDKSLVDIMDLGSDSESDGEGFVKLNAPPKENTPEKATSETNSNDSTPRPLNKSEVMDFARLGADLKAHIAEEQKMEEEKPINQTEESAPQLERDLRAVPVVEQMETTEDKPEANVPIYHSDERINKAVHAMMSMGFGNEGAMLTQLLTTVNGNISEAIDILF